MVAALVLGEWHTIHETLKFANGNVVILLPSILEDMNSKLWSLELINGNYNKVLIGKKYVTTDLFLGN